MAEGIGSGSQPYREAEGESENGAFTSRWARR